MAAKMAKGNKINWFKPVYGLIVLSLLISACGGKQPSTSESTPTTVLQDTPIATALPSLTPTPQPSVLNICTAQEPVSLYRYDGRNSESKKTIFSLIYGQTVMEFDEVSSLLESMPTFENGGIRLLETKVLAGDVIVDATGQMTVLRQGTSVIPHGCASADCVRVWDGESELTMSSLEISYQLKESLKWSDGEPLTVEDLLFSFQISSDESTPTNKQSFDLTERVFVEGDLTFVWQGVPGLTNQKPEHSFWLPLPKHQFETLTPSELLESQIATGEPLGWGAYRLVSWERGQQLKFEKNPFFNRADQGKPFDFLNITIIPDQESALEAFNYQQCDVLDSSYGLEAIPTDQLAGTIHIQEPSEVGTLVFGVIPASYDDGHAAWDEERADYFGDIRTRQAIALCIDPVKLSSILGGQELALNAPILPDVDPNTLLDAVGWVDSDANQSTPRLSRGVETVTDSTPFEINLFNGQGEADTFAAAEISKRLGDCGIKVNISNLSAAQLYAPGPEGILFGRQFDLAIVNWAGYTSTADRCEYYLSSQVPGVENSWVGTNLAGYKNLAYDAACLTATLSEGDRVDPLIALDLVPRVKVWVSRNGAVTH